MRVWENSYIIITSDHGEALNEHGHWDHGQSVHNATNRRLGAKIVPEKAVLSPEEQKRLRSLGYVQ